MLFMVLPALAHESQPCLLNLRQLDSDTWQLSWRTPPGRGAAYPVSPELPQEWEVLETSKVRSMGDYDLQLQLLRIPAGAIDGSLISFPGLRGSPTDVYVRLSRLDGTQFSAVVRSTSPVLVLRGSRSWQQTTGEFIALGCQHILLGIDHLLFVFGLLLIVRGNRALLRTITAFTLAHSITLALASLGIVSIARAPVEASIAMSIMFLGPEIIRARRGESSLTIRQPWLVAFVFGLLHGFGFASGLSLAGIPQAEIPLGLLSFNIGVELGQLMFVGVVLLLGFALRSWKISLPNRLQQAPAYIVGIAGAFWFIQRTFQIIAG
jgi:hydrogenase/urease accessory protein HupE